MKQVFKQIANIFFVISVSPLIVVTRLFPNSNVFDTCAHLLSLVPGKLGVYVRRCYYHYVMTYCSLSSCIVFGTVFSQQDTEIGDGVYIGAQCNIGMCKIGNYTLLGSGVHILSGKQQHNFDSLDIPIQEQGGQFEKILVGEDSWLGNGSIIMANVGNRCIVAAGSVVTKDVPDRSIVAGNPAKVVKVRS